MENTSVKLPTPIAGLLETLQKKITGWTQEDRDKFIAIFGVMLDFCIPIIPPGLPKQFPDA